MYVRHTYTYIHSYINFTSEFVGVCYRAASILILKLHYFIRNYAFGTVPILYPSCYVDVMLLNNYATNNIANS